MKQIKEPNTTTDADIIASGIMVNYTGNGLGAGKVGLVVCTKNGYYIKWSNGTESIDYRTFKALFYSCRAEFYLVNR